MCIYQYTYSIYDRFKAPRKYLKALFLEYNLTKECFEMEVGQRVNTGAGEVLILDIQKDYLILFNEENKQFINIGFDFDFSLAELN